MRSTAPGRVLTDPRGASFRFDPGATCLDFAHTGGEGDYAVFETLHEPTDLADWLALPPFEVSVTSPVTAAELQAAKALRQAIWIAAHDRAAGRPLSPDAIGVINRVAATEPLVPALDPDASLARWVRPVTAGRAASTLAREMIELLAGPFGHRIRECASDTCPLVFVDLSRPGARRWCSMERCGNRAKLRARRARER